MPKTYYTYVALTMNRYAQRPGQTMAFLGSPGERSRATALPLALLGGRLWPLLHNAPSDGFVVS